MIPPAWQLTYHARPWSLNVEGPDEWCHTCVAEVAWSAWKLGVLR